MEKRMATQAIKGIKAPVLSERMVFPLDYNSWLYTTVRNYSELLSIEETLHSESPSVWSIFPICFFPTLTIFNTIIYIR